MTRARAFRAPAVPRFPAAPLAALTFLVLLLVCAAAAPAADAAPTPPREGILLVAFGTSVPEAEASFTAMDAAFRAAWPHSPVVWAYTSQIIRKKLAREGRPLGASRRRRA